jgi:hypothetical protein
LLLSIFSTSVEVQAATYYFAVDTTNDTIDANLTDNICADAQNNCSLRAALEQSRPLTQSDHIVNILFNLPSPATIEITSDLPTYTQANLINDNPLKRITIDGNNNFGLVISGNQSTTVEGLIFMNFRLAPIFVYFGGTDFITNNVLVHNENGLAISNVNNGEQGVVHVTGNDVGYDPFTESKNPNNKGIYIKDVSSVYSECEVWIGGNSAEEGNVIAGNNLSGIYVENENLNTDIFILNNYIGMVDDTSAEPNSNHGIEVVKSAGILNIGEDYLTQGNLIAGNENLGVYIGESNSASIQGNIFSSNAAGTAYIPNDMGDVKVFDSPYLRIGGETTEYGNVIPQGVSVESNTVNNVNLLIKHNFLGISRDGFVYPIDPDQDGIFIEDATGYPEISFNQITNFNKGIVILNDSVVPISKNKIFGNREMEIDLDDDGVSLNDPLDADTGPNGLQNYPVILNVVLQDFDTVRIVSFDVSLSSAPNKRYYIEVFSSRFCGSNGYGQGRQGFAYNGSITTDSSGNSGIWHISELYPTNIIGPCLSATAAEFDGTHYLGTSEFSPGVMAWQPEQIFLPMIIK